MAIATYLPSSIYYGAASGTCYPAFYAPGSSATAGAGFFEGVGVVSSVTSSSLAYPVTLQFNLGTTSTAALTLRTLFLANATSGSAKFTPNDGVAAVNGVISATTLTAESQVTFTSTAADILYQNNTVLASAPSSSGILTVRIDFNSTGGWSLAAASVFQFSVTQ